MTVSPQVLYSGGQLTNAAATLFTASANVKTMITEWSFTNVDTVARELTVYLVRSGGAASAANTLIDDYVIQPGETYTPPTGQILGEGDFIQAKADANTAITCAGISGYRISN